MCLDRLERNGKPYVPFVCPKCGGPVNLEECGTYSGRRLVEPDGTITDGSYLEYGSEPTQFYLHCRSCEYEDHRVVVEGDKIYRMASVTFGRRRTDGARDTL